MYTVCINRNGTWTWFGEFATWLEAWNFAAGIPAEKKISFSIR